MDLIPFPDHIQREVVAGPFYCHPYGGVARDIDVTKEGFARFFELDVDAMELASDPDSTWFGKIIDQMNEWTECCGYRGRKHGEITYSITIIEHGHSRVHDLLAIAPYLWGAN